MYIYPREIFSARWASKWKWFPASRRMDRPDWNHVSAASKPSSLPFLRPYSTFLRSARRRKRRSKNMPSNPPLLLTVMGNERRVHSRRDTPLRFQLNHNDSSHYARDEIKRLPPLVRVFVPPTWLFYTTGETRDHREVSSFIIAASPAISFFVG